MIVDLDSYLPFITAVLYTGVCYYLRDVIFSFLISPLNWLSLTKFELKSLVNEKFKSTVNFR